jgi:hypothetical protein
MTEPIDTLPIIGSHTATECGIYDAEPFPVEGNAYYWYIRAVYWKREANRKEGVQQTMDFTEKSNAVYGGPLVGDIITLAPHDLKIVKDFITGPMNGGFTNKINAIKYVRTVAGCGLKEAKDYVNSLG